jgi:bisphosphoglycerate-independent phosphoglycerate mutase (AlkP superfamily)
MRYYPKIKIASIASRSHLKDTNKEETYNYYRMLVSSVGEVWIDYMTTIERKYARHMTDDTMNAFLTIQGFYIKPNDSIFIFNYSNNIGKTLFDIFLNPKKYFPTSNVPENIKLLSLFPVTNMTNVIPPAFEDELPEAYFLDKIPDEKKVLIIAEKDRVPYISKSLNGFRPSFTQNISVWPITDKAKRFEQTSQYLAAYINQAAYDLIIVDCEFYDPSIDAKTIDQLKENAKELDKVINITYSRATEKDYRLIISSLYGIRDSFKLTTTMENVNMSQKVPFLLIDREIRRVDVVFKSYGTFIDVARLIAISYGSRMSNELIQLGTVEEKQESNNKKKILFIAVGVLLLLLVIGYLKMYGVF